MTKALQRAITIAGSEDKLARGIGYSQAAVSKAKSRGRVSAEMALAIHRYLGGAISASEIRPDLWASPDHVPAEHRELT